MYYIIKVTKLLNKKYVKVANSITFTLTHQSPLIGTEKQ